MATLGIVLSGCLGGKITSHNTQEFFARPVRFLKPDRSTKSASNEQNSLPFQNHNERSTCAHYAKNQTTGSSTTARKNRSYHVLKARYITQFN